MSDKLNLKECELPVQLQHVQLPNAFITVTHVGENHVIYIKSNGQECTLHISSIESWYKHTPKTRELSGDDIREVGREILIEYSNIGGESMLYKLIKRLEL